MNKILASLAMASFLMTGSAMAQTATPAPKAPAAAKHKHMVKKGSKKGAVPAASTAP